MPTATLLVAGGMSVAVGISFALVARKVLARRVEGDAQTALRAFATFWAGLAVYLVIQGGLTVAAGFGAISANIYYATRFVNIPALCAAIWGITSYLFYLYTGSAKAFRLTAVGALIVAVVFVAATVTGPREVEAAQWILHIDDTGVLYRIVYIALGIPPIVAAGAYLMLARRLDDRAQKYRTVLVSGSILGYVGSGLAARLAAHDATIFVTLVLFGAAAAGAALMAYYPPPSVQAWLAGTERPVRDNAAWHRRMVELI